MHMVPLIFTYVRAHAYQMRTWKSVEKIGSQAFFAHAFVRYSALRLLSLSHYHITRARTVQNFDR